MPPAQGHRAQLSLIMFLACRSRGLNKGEVGVSILGVNQAEKSEPTGKKTIGGSSALDTPRLRGCSEPGKFARRRRATLPFPASAGAGSAGAHLCPPRPPPGARSRSPLTGRQPVRGEGTQDALRLGLGLWPGWDPQGRAPMEGKPAGRQTETEGEGRRPTTPGPAPLPHLPGSASEMLPLPPPPPLVRARPGPAPLRLRLLGRGCPAAACLPASLRRRLCHRCTALCPPPSRPPSLLRSLLPRALPLGPPQTLHGERPAGPERVVEPAPSSARTCGAARGGVSGLSGVPSPGTKISTSPLPHATPTVSPALGGTPPHPFPGSGRPKPPFLQHN